MLDCGLGCRQLYTVFRSPDTGRNGVGMARTKGQLPLPTVRRSSVELEVYRVLRQALLSGRLGEERLVQEELAASLGVSRISVRTALQRLETEGLVTIDERGSYYAKRIDLPDLEEVYSLRALLEPYATRLAVPRLQSDDIAVLRELVQRMADCVADPDTYVELNEQFHRRIYSASAQPRLVRMIEGLWSGLPPITPKVVPGQLERSLRAHTAILAAIEAADAGRAAALIEKHIRTAGARLMASVVGDHSER